MRQFTANYFAADCHKINLVQCRPLQVSGGSDGPFWLNADTLQQQVLCYVEATE